MWLPFFFYILPNSQTALFPLSNFYLQLALFALIFKLKLKTQLAWQQQVQLKTAHSDPGKGLGREGPFH